MARARNIKPGLFKNEVLGVAAPLYTLLYQGHWLLADREGRLEDRPMRIRAEVFPYREGLDMESMLGWLEAAGFIQRYQVGGLALNCQLSTLGFQLVVVGRPLAGAIRRLVRALTAILAAGAGRARRNRGRA